MPKRHEHIFQLTQDWLVWSNSRKYYTKRGIKCVLGKLQPFTGDPEFIADGELSPLMAAFNLAISYIEGNKLILFVVVYCEIRPKTVGELAKEYGVSRNQFYNLAHEVALEIYRSTLKILHGESNRDGMKF